METIEALRDAGLLVAWDRTVGPCWTLTPWGAAAARVELIEHGVRETARWAERGTVPPRLFAARQRGQMGMTFPELVRAAGGEDLEDGPESLRDDYSGEPVTLWGRVVYRETTQRHRITARGRAGASNGIHPH